MTHRSRTAAGLQDLMKEGREELNSTLIPQLTHSRLAPESKWLGWTAQSSSVQAPLRTPSLSRGEEGVAAWGRAGTKWRPRSSCHEGEAKDSYAICTHQGSPCCACVCDKAFTKLSCTPVYQYTPLPLGHARMWRSTTSEKDHSLQVHRTCYPVPSDMITLTSLLLPGWLSDTGHHYFSPNQGTGKKLPEVSAKLFPMDFGMKYAYWKINTTWMETCCQETPCWLHCPICQHLRYLPSLSKLTFTLRHKEASSTQDLRPCEWKQTPSWSQIKLLTHDLSLTSTVLWTEKWWKQWYWGPVLQPGCLREHGDSETGTFSI